MTAALLDDDAARKNRGLPLAPADFTPAQKLTFEQTADFLIDNGVRVSMATDTALDKALGRGEYAPNQDHPADELPAGRVSIVRGDSITPEPINWLWRGYIARGKPQILAGAAGTGKTTLALAMGATTTTGGRWPDGTRAEVGDVLIWSGEDDPADTLIPRLLAMGADVGRVHFVGNVNDDRGMRAFDPASDVQLLSDRFADCGDVALLIVDPIVSAVSGDSHKNGEVRRNLQPLVDLAARHGCALIGITHYSKGTAGRDPLERVTGSLAFGALARIVLGTAKPTEAGEPRRLVRAKSNIGPDGSGFEYDLEQVEVPTRPGLFASRVLWGKAIEGTARDLLAAVEGEPEEQAATDDASEFVRECLTEAGGTMERRELFAAGKRAGFSERAMERSRNRAGITARTSAFGKDRRSMWTLAEHHSRQIPRTRNDGGNGGNGGYESNEEPISANTANTAIVSSTREAGGYGDGDEPEPPATGEAYRRIRDGEPL